jgi:hypothetical protein
LNLRQSPISGSGTGSSNDDDASTKAGSNVLVGYSDDESSSSESSLDDGGDSDIISSWNRNCPLSDLDDEAVSDAEKCDGKQEAIDSFAEILAGKQEATDSPPVKKSSSSSASSFFAGAPKLKSRKAILAARKAKPQKKRLPALKRLLNRKLMLGNERRPLNLPRCAPGSNSKPSRRRRIG